MNTVKSLIRVVKRARLSLRSQTRSHILQLPIEVLLRIFEYLPPYSQLLVYQTCRPLRTIIHQYFLSGKGDILAAPKDRLCYLTHLARSLPDRWVCAKCCKLHQTCEWDTPKPQNYTPKCRDGLSFVDERSECRKLPNTEYAPCHRHLELTLKYARLKSPKKKHQKHLQRLLAPYHVDSQISGGMSVANGVRAQSSFYPKVVDGRYLLFSAHAYIASRGTILQQSIEFLIICPHVYSFGAFCGRNTLTRDLDMILYTCFSAPPNTIISTSCLACKTDITIEASLERLIICTWQDLGPEATVYDPDWEAIVRNTTSVYHETGSIEELYGQNEHKCDCYIG